MRMYSLYKLLGICKEFLTNYRIPKYIKIYAYADFYTLEFVTNLISD